MKNFKIGFIGAGNMATAILNGILKTQIVLSKSILVSDIDNEKLNILKKKGVATTNDNAYLFKNAEYIIFAVKPQIAVKILPQLKDNICDNLFISIMAGLTKDKLKGMLGNVRIARIMPNTPCMVGKGMCAIDASDFNSDSQKLVFDIFESLGEILPLDEKYFDAVTAVSGSGPAYVYMFIDAMIKGGIKAGLKSDESKKLTLQTFLGAIKMVENSNTPIETLIKNVCSKGGTTIQAVEHYQNSDLQNIIIEGMEKCKNRSKELSAE